MNCTVCNGKGYFPENHSDCSTCSGSGKVPTMSMPEVLSLLYSSRNANEWEHNCNVVKLSYEGVLPNFWHDLVINSGMYKIMQESWKY